MSSRSIYRVIGIPAVLCALATVQAGPVSVSTTTITSHPIPSPPPPTSVLPKTPSSPALWARLSPYATGIVTHTHHLSATPSEFVTLTWSFTTKAIPISHATPTPKPTVPPVRGSHEAVRSEAELRGLREIHGQYKMVDGAFVDGEGINYELAIDVGFISPGQWTPYALRGRCPAGSYDFPQEDGSYECRLPGQEVLEGWYWCPPNTLLRQPELRKTLPDGRVIRGICETDSTIKNEPDFTPFWVCPPNTAKAENKAYDCWTFFENGEYVDGFGHWCNWSSGKDESLLRWRDTPYRRVAKSGRIIEGECVEFIEGTRHDSGGQV